MKASKGGSGGDAQTRVANTLVDLRTTVTELDPNRADLAGAKKVLKWLPGGDKIQRYFAKYESAQSHLNAIIKSLESGQDELRKDNAAIETEKANMWTTMGKLSEYQQLAAALDDAVTQKIAELEAAGRTEDANALKSDALFAIRQRRQDIMTQMAVSVQGYMALDLVRKNNVELIKGVDRAQTTTVSALRTAVIVSQALSRQKLVLDQITALNDDDVQPDRVDVEPAQDPGHRDQPAGGEQHDRRAEAAGSVRQRLPDDGRDRHVPRAGGRLDGADRHRARGPDRAGQALPRAHPPRRGRRADPAAVLS